ncbi:MAG TPA: glycosyltransferase family 87 protein [Ktedonobacterales bacterium]
MSGGPRFHRLWQVGLWLVILIVWGVWFKIMTVLAGMAPTHALDFDVYYAAAQALRFDHSANIYDIATLLHAGHVHGLCSYAAPALPPYLYPPLLAIALEPLTLLPCASAAIVWLYFNATLWAAATLLLADVLAMRWPGRRLEATALMSIVSLCFWHAYYGAQLGQVHLIVLAGIVLAMWLVERGRPGLAGGALAVVMIIKLFPALLVVYYLLRGRFRVLGGVAIVGAVLVVIMLVWSSPLTFERSLSAAFVGVSKLARPGMNEALFVTSPIGRLLAAMVGVVFLAVNVARRRGDALLGVGWTLCTMLLISPLVWSFYLVWLVPTFCACLAAIGPLNGGSWGARSMWALFATLYVALVWQAPLPVPPLATLALWALTGALYWRSSGAAPRTRASDAVLGAGTKAVRT